MEHHEFRSNGAEHVFNGSLAIQVILIAVAGIIAAAYDKISGIPDVELNFRVFLWGIAALSIVGCALSLISLAQMYGWRIPRFVATVLMTFLIVGISVTSVGIVVVTIY